MSRERGRPRSFDVDAALDRALEVFWKHGFQDASLLELTETMGLSKPSLYAAFGDKEALYLKALDRYLVLQISSRAAILDVEEDGRCAIEAFLRSIVAMLIDPALPGGCFIINGTADLGGSSTPAAVEQALRKALQGSEAMLLKRLQRAQKDGQLSQDVNVHHLAALFASIIAGLAVLAKSGASKSKLCAVVDTAMAVWPMRH